MLRLCRPSRSTNVIAASSTRVCVKGFRVLIASHVSFRDPFAFVAMALARLLHCMVAHGVDLHCKV